MAVRLHWWWCVVMCGGVWWCVVVCGGVVVCGVWYVVCCVLCVLCVVCVCMCVRVCAGGGGCGTGVPGRSTCARIVDFGPLE